MISGEGETGFACRTRGHERVCAVHVYFNTDPASSRGKEIRSSRAALCKANMAGVSAMIERSGQRAPRRFDRPTDLVFRIHRIAWEPGTDYVHSSRLPAHERAGPFEPCCLGPFLLGPVALSGPFHSDSATAPRFVLLSSFWVPVIPFDFHLMSN